MSGCPLRPGRRPAQYSARRNRQCRRAFTVMSSARKAAHVQKRLLFRGRSPVQTPIAMREAPEPANYGGAVFGVLEVCGSAGNGEGFDAAKLAGEMRRMSERHG